MTNTALGSRLSALGMSDRRVAAAGVLGFVVAISAASQVSLPIPGTPVPFTLQPMLVVLAGLMLGPTLGTASMLTYLAIGAAGAPVFTPGGLPGIARFFGPTGGYLLAYPAAAAV
ncbi:MAG TPA: biotin transporter BioY, partial [Gemmatimonadaceae bacterium]